MNVYRICKDIHSHDLTGKGAELFGGRWNKKGTPLLYTSGSRALAVLEMLVHVPPNLIPKNLSIVTIDVPDILKIHSLEKNSLPKKWNTFPAPLELHDIIAKWLKSNTSVVIKVPSAIVNKEDNFLLNPNHKDYNKIKIITAEKFRIDKRLIK